MLFQSKGLLKDIKGKFPENLRKKQMITLNPNNFEIIIRIY